MSASPDPVAPGAPPAAALPPVGQDPFSSAGEEPLTERRPELLAAAGFAGGLALALILKRLGS